VVADFLAPLVLTLPPLSPVIEQRSPTPSPANSKSAKSTSMKTERPRVKYDVQTISICSSRAGQAAANARHHELNRNRLTRLINLAFVVSFRVFGPSFCGAHMQLAYYRPPNTRSYS